MRIENVIADVNRDATRLTSAPGTSEAFRTGFAQDSDDQAVDYSRGEGLGGRREQIDPRALTGPRRVHVNRRVADAEGRDACAQQAQGVGHRTGAVAGRRMPVPATACPDR
ncbi:hypothetical protein OG780_40225 [Streptomyces sp. NBC_00386]|uniref:hypothetical protein n=1 Tax=Streptomyces sp. NBC_00386 TaxID=2975734 RepID=UPI002E249CB1